MKTRKADHIRICSTKDVESGDPGFSALRLKHMASPELSYDGICTETSFLGKCLGFPLIFEAITGGTRAPTRHR